MKNVLIIIALAALYQATGCLVIGPQPFVRDWVVPRGGGYSFNASLILAGAQPGSGLELGFVEGPYRAGFIIVFNDTCGTVYVMTGDQNSWHMVGCVEPGVELELGLRVSDNGSINAWLGGGEVRYDYEGTPGFKYFRVAVFGIHGGLVARILGLDVRVNGSSIDLGICQGSGPQQGGGGQGGTGGNNTGCPSNNTGVSQKQGEKGWSPVTVFLAVVLVVIVVYALLWLRSRGRRPRGSRPSSGGPSF